MNSKLFKYIFLALFFVGTLFVANSVSADTTLIMGQIQANGADCSGGNAGACQSLVNSNTKVLVSNNSGLQFPIGSEGFGLNWQSTGSWDARTFYNPNNSGLDSSFGIGRLLNVPGGFSGIQVNYSCNLGGTYTDYPASVNSDGTWNAAIPNNGSTCTLDIIDPNNIASSPPSSACGGATGITCVANQCRAGQCSLVTADVNGVALAPGTKDTCFSTCTTNMSVTISPLDNFITLGSGVQEKKYVLTFSHNGPADKLQVGILCPNGATCHLNNSSDVQITGFSSGGYVTNGDGTIGYNSGNYTVQLGYSPSSMATVIDAPPGNNSYIYYFYITSPTVGTYTFSPSLSVIQHPMVGCSGTCNTFSQANFRVVQGCTSAPFVSGSVSPVPPTSVASGDNFALTCNYGRTTSNISAPPNCTFTGWSGFNAQYNCVAPATAGTYSYNCKLNNVPSPGDNLCALTNPAGTLSVSSSAPTQCQNSIITAPNTGQCTSISNNSLGLKWNLAGPAGSYTRQVVRVATNLADVYGNCVSTDPANCRDIAVNASTFSAVGLTTGTTYYNRVAAVCTNPDNSIGYKDVIWTCDTTPTGGGGMCLDNPSQPTVNGQSINSDVVFSASPGSLTFSWSPVSNATNGYTLVLYDSNSSLPGTIIKSQSVPAGTTSYTFNNITPNSSLVRSRYSLYLSTNPTGTTSCGTITLWQLWVRPPVTSCPGTPTMVLDTNPIYQGGGSWAYPSPASSYSCTNYTSSNNAVASVDPSTGQITGNGSGVASIGASSCTYNGLSCPINPATLSVSSSMPPSTNYGFSMPTFFNFGNIGSSEVCQPISIVNTTTGGNSNVTGLHVTFPYGLGYSQGVTDKQIDISGAYNFLNETWPGPISNQLCVPTGLSPGSHTDSAVYGMYNQDGSETSAQRKTVTAMFSVPDLIYTFNPNWGVGGQLVFTAVQNGPLPVSQVIAVNNTGTGPLNFTVSKSALTTLTSAMYTISPTTFILNPSQNQNVTVAMATTALTPGVYNGTVDFSEPNAGIKKVGIKYTITSTGTQCTDPSSRPARTMTAPASAPANSPFQITCGYGSDQDNVQVTSGLGAAYDCSWTSWSSPSGPGVFNCPAVPSPQSVTYTCQAQNVGAPFTNWCTLPASQQKTVAITSNLGGGVAACGTADVSNKTYAALDTSYGGDTFCAAGTVSPVSPAFPAQGGTSPWICTTSGGSGNTVNCAAHRLSNNATVTVTATSCGTVSSNPSGINSCTQATCQADFPQGSNVTLAATPSNKCLFSGWTGDCSGTGTCTLNNISSPKNVSARFILKPLIYQEF